MRIRLGRKSSVRADCPTYSVESHGRHPLLGYSHFFAGDYYSATPGAATDADANFFYAQYEFNF